MIPYKAAWLLRTEQKAPPSKSTDLLLDEIARYFRLMQRTIEDDRNTMWKDGHQAALISIGITLQLDCPDDGNYTVASICDEIEKRIKP